MANPHLPHDHGQTIEQELEHMPSAGDFQIVADILQKAYAGGFAIKNRGYDTERVESSVFLVNKGEMIRKQENQKYTKKPRLS